MIRFPRLKGGQLHAAIALLAVAGISAAFMAMHDSPLVLAPPDFASAAGLCVGPDAATAGVIYLHGIDPPMPSPTDIANRKSMARIADALGLRIALPRSPYACPNDPAKRCWPNDNKAAVGSTWDRIRADTNACIGDRPLASVVGFSNGGYFVGKLFQYCFVPATPALLAIGSAGGWRAADPRLDLGGCGRLIQLIGTEDMTHDAAVRYVDQLHDRGATAELREYKGAHVFPPGEVEGALRMPTLGL